MSAGDGSSSEKLSELWFETEFFGLKHMLSAFIYGLEPENTWPAWPTNLPHITARFGVQNRIFDEATCRRLPRLTQSCYSVFAARAAYA